MKTFVENFLKTNWILIERNLKIADKWQNNDEDTIKWYQFIVKLFINKLYFTKTEIIYEATKKKNYSWMIKFFLYFKFYTL